MNPGNGIETDTELFESIAVLSFNLMNPGNGIET